MRPENTEERRRKEKRSAVRGVVLFGLIQAACAVCLASLCSIPALPRWAFILFAALASLCLVLILLALWVLKERFREIEGGEKDAASQY